MGKKKVEVLLGFDLYFDEKAKINKSTVKALLESKVKGLKVGGFRAFTNVKDTYHAELSCNILHLLHAEEMLKEMIRPEDLHGSEEHKGEQAGVLDKALEGLRVLATSYNDSARKKVVAENLLRFLDPIENHIMAAGEELKALNKENMSLKISLDNLCNADMAAVVAKPIAPPMGQASELIEKLKRDNSSLENANAELLDKLRMYEKNLGEKVFLEQLKKFEREMEEKEALHQQELQELEERLRVLTLQFMEKDDRIRELELELTKADKQEIVDMRKEIDSLRSSLKLLDKKCSEAEGQAAGLKQKLATREEENKQLTSELAQCLDKNLALEKELKMAETRRIMRPGMAPRGAVAEEDASGEAEAAGEIAGVQIEEVKINEERNQKLVEELQQKTAKLSYFTVLLADREEEIVKLRGEYEEVLEQHLKSEKELKLVLMDVERIADEKSRMVAEGDQLKRTLYAYDQRENTIAEEVEALRKDIEDKVADRLHLLEIIEERNNIIRQNEDKFSQYENNKEQLEKLVHALQGQLSRDFDKEDDSAVELKLKVEEYRNIMKMLDADVQSMTAKLKVGEGELKRLRQQKQEDDERLARLGKELDAANKGATEREEQLRLEVGKVQNVAEQRNAEVARLNGEAVRSHEEIEKLRQSQSELREKMASSERQSESSGEERRTLQEKLKILENANKECRTQLDSLKECIAQLEQEKASRAPIPPPHSDSASTTSGGPTPELSAPQAPQIQYSAEPPLNSTESGELAGTDPALRMLALSKFAEQLRALKEEHAMLRKLTDRAKDSIGVTIQDYRHNISSSNLRQILEAVKKMGKAHSSVVAQLLAERSAREGLETELRSRQLESTNSCSQVEQLRQKLEEKSKQSEESQKSLAQLQGDMKQLLDETNLKILTLTESHEKALQQAHSRHAEEKEKLNAEHNAALTRSKEEHRKSAQQAQEYPIQLEQLQQQFASLKEKEDEKLSIQQARHEQQLKETRDDYETLLANYKRAKDDIQLSHLVQTEEMSKQNSEKEAEYRELLERYERKNDELQNKLLILQSERSDEVFERNYKEEVISYLQEMVYLYKTILSSSQEKIEEYGMKLERIGVLKKILEEMKDPKINRDKLKLLLTNSMKFLPFFTGLDLKSDFKLLTLGTMKVIEHRKEKESGYEDSKERNQMILGYAEPKLQLYTEKLKILMSKP